MSIKLTIAYSMLLLYALLISSAWAVKMLQESLSVDSAGKVAVEHNATRSPRANFTRRPKRFALTWYERQRSRKAKQSKAGQSKATPMGLPSPVDRRTWVRGLSRRLWSRCDGFQLSSCYGCGLSAGKAPVSKCDCGCAPLLKTNDWEIKNRKVVYVKYDGTCPNEEDPEIEAVYAEMIPKYKGKNGKVLYLWPSADHNTHFAFTSELCERIMCWRANEKQVTMRIVTTIEDAMKVLDDYKDLELTDVILGGHGSPDGMHWGEKFGEGLSTFFEKDHMHRSSDFLDKLRKKVRGGGSVLIHACSTAGGNSAFNNFFPNFFSFVAKHLPGRKVTGGMFNMGYDTWKKGPNYIENDEDCLKGDNVRFEKTHEDGTMFNGTAVSQFLPNCDEVHRDSFTKANPLEQCLSGCAFSPNQVDCAEVMTKCSSNDNDQGICGLGDPTGNVYVMLVWDEDKADPDDFGKGYTNPCVGAPVRQQTVCQIVVRKSR